MDAAQPVSRLARRTIDRRLKRVARLLPLAAKEPERDVEYVHDLRVAVRKASAALRIFRPCLPPSLRNELDSRLRRVRRAAGPARDLDVIGQRLSRLSEAWGTTLQLSAALDRIGKERRRAQKPLVKAHRRARRQGLRSLFRRTSRRVGWYGEGAEPEVRVWVDDALRPVLDRFFARSSADLTDTAALHAMRIAEKRLRYSLEVVGEVSGASFTRVAPLLGELQDRLGEINDHDAACSLLLRWRRRSKDAELREVFGQLASFERWSGSYAHDQFLAWWDDDRRTDLAERLNALLDRVSGSQPRLDLAGTGRLSTIATHK